MIEKGLQPKPTYDINVGPRAAMGTVQVQIFKTQIALSTQLLKALALTHWKQVDLKPQEQGFQLEQVLNNIKIYLLILIYQLITKS